jgi:hypothetical protein
MPEPNAILAINSTDRYVRNQGANGQPATISEVLQNLYNVEGQPCNNFQVGGFGALIYGYIKYIVVSQIQLTYNVPTVIPNKNDQFLIFAKNGAGTEFTIGEFIIPYGYYTPEELTSLLTILILESNINTTLGGSATVPGITVTYDTTYNGFDFKAVDDEAQFYFPDIEIMKAYITTLELPPSRLDVWLKCYRLLGMDIGNSTYSNNQISSVQINFLYTPFVDIFSTALTKYQKVKDNTTNNISDSTLVSRLFLSGSGNPVNTAGETPAYLYPNLQPPPPVGVNAPGIPITNMSYPLGSRAFIVVQDCNTPKVVRWSKDETVYALDFQLRDQYGDLLFTDFEQGQFNGVYYTEFQMTLLCVEGERQ